MPTSPFGKTSYWLIPVLLDDPLSAHRDMIMELMASEGIQTRVTFPSLHRMPAFRDFPANRDVRFAASIEERGLCLPNTPKTTMDSVQFVLKVLHESIKKTTALVGRGNL